MPGHTLLTRTGRPPIRAARGPRQIDGRHPFEAAYAVIFGVLGKEAPDPEAMFTIVAKGCLEEPRQRAPHDDVCAGQIDVEARASSPQPRHRAPTRGSRWPAALTTPSMATHSGLHPVSTGSRKLTPSCVTSASTASAASLSGWTSANLLRVRSSRQGQRCTLCREQALRFAARSPTRRR